MDLKELVAGVEAEMAPGFITRQFEDSKIEDLQLCFGNLRKISQQSWMAEAACIGIAHERVGNKRGVIAALAKTFLCHRSRVSRASRIYQEIIKPRIEKFGSDAEFLIEERSYYEAACDASERLGVPALELIEVAEENKLNNPNYSLRKFRDDINPAKDEDAEGGLIDEAKKFARKMGEVSFIHDDTVFKFVEVSDNPQGWLDVLDRVQRVAGLAQSKLREKLDTLSDEFPEEDLDCPTDT